MKDGIFKNLEANVVFLFEGDPLVGSSFDEAELAIIDRARKDTTSSRGEWLIAFLEAALQIEASRLDQEKYDRKQRAVATTDLPG